MEKAEQRCVQAPSVAILWHDKLSRIICRGEQCSPVLRICCKSRIVGENFLLPNLVVAVGLLLRRANSVRQCSGFAVNSELSGRIFLLPNLVVTVGLFLRRANTVRPCSGFAVNSELSGRIFLLPNLVVTVGLFLRRANTVRPCSGFAVNSELSGRIFCCRTLLLPWFCFFDGRTVFAPTHTSS